MYLDSVDFFPGYDPYYSSRQQEEPYNFFKSLCIHLLAILLAIGICGSALYYYEHNKPYKFYLHESPPDLSSKTSGVDIDKISKEMEKIKESIENTSQWRNQLTDLFSRIYKHQDAMITQAIEKALDVYDSDKIGMFGKQNSPPK